MDYYKYKAVDEGLPQGQQPSTFFTQQAILAGYVAPPPQFVNKLDHIQHQPVNMREASMREIEKERIREQIIAEVIARRRMLRRELMMERQLAK